MKITLVAGARPNFIKIAPIIKAIEKKQNEGEKESGVWRRKSDNDKPVTNTKPDEQQTSTKYVPPWKKNASK